MNIFKNYITFVFEMCFFVKIILIKIDYYEEIFLVFYSCSNALYCM